MGSQVWSMEKLENKLVDMRDMYEDRKDPNNCQRLPAIKVGILTRIQKILKRQNPPLFQVNFYKKKKRKN